MDYTALHNHLKMLESLVNPPSPPPGPSSGALSCIRNNGKAKVQGFGLDSSTSQAGELPVVIAVGANYTQGKEMAPRDRQASSIVEDPSLEVCRTSLDAGLKLYNSCHAFWIQRGAASASKPSPEVNYHLVMTNFCLWITDKSWQKTEAHLRVDLLENNPAFGSSPVCSPNWIHLTKLNKHLLEVDEYHKPLWVAHGIHCEVFSLFRAFVRKAKIENWLLMPNLSYPYRYYSCSPTTNPKFP